MRSEACDTSELGLYGALLKRRDRREHESLSGVDIYRPCYFMFTSALRPMETQRPAETTARPDKT